MIKSTHPEFESLVRGETVPANPALLGFLEDTGVPHIVSDYQVALAGNLELLDENRILAEIKRAPNVRTDLIPPMEIHRVIGSTNDLVMMRLDHQASLLCTAEMQTAGRGRRGRNWVSPFGRNVYLTYGRRMRRPLSELGGLSLVVGMQVVEVLRDAGIAAGLKWPNDVLLNGGKLGGILVELKTAVSAGVGVVAGVGLNLHLDASDASQIDQAFSVAESSKSLSRNHLIGAIAGRMITAFDQFDHDGFAPFWPDWPRYNLYAGQEIRVLRGGGEFRHGRDAGIDSEGNLIIDTHNGLEVYNSGEVSMRPV